MLSLHTIVKAAVSMKAAHALNNQKFHNATEKKKKKKLGLRFGSITMECPISKVSGKLPSRPQKAF